MSDDEGDVRSTPVPDHSVELGNVQNQLQSTNRSLESSKTERQQVEQQISNQAGQLSSLQTQLASAKAAFETETRLLTTLRERFAAQSSEMQKIREELISAESNLSAIRIEKTEIEGNLMRDREDHRELQRKMKEAGDEAERLKVSVEKMKKDTKHQKGLLAIAKKQLATREADKLKAAKDLEDAESEASATILDLQNTEADLAKVPSATNAGETIVSPVPRMDTPSFAAAVALPTSPSPQGSVSSPAGAAKRNNPFDRFTMAKGTPSGTQTPRAQSPPSHMEGAQLNTGEGIGSPFDETPAFIGSSDEIPRTSSPFMHNSDFTSTSSPPPEVPRAASPFMHVAEGSTDSESTENGEDPFGISDIGRKSTDGVTSKQSASPPPPPPPASESESVLSPDTSFQTASTSPHSDNTSPTPKTPESKKTTDTVIAAAKEQFPPIDQDFHFDGGVVDNSPDSPEMPTRALEIEPEESDSDSDSEFQDANAHLSGSEKQKQTFPELTPKQGDTSMLESSANADKQAGGAFNDAFGVIHNPTNGISAPTDLFDETFGSTKASNGEASKGFDDAFAVKDEVKGHDATKASSTDLLNNFFSEMSSPPVDKPTVNGGSDNMNGEFVACVRPFYSKTAPD